MSRGREKGFTLIELLIVVAIIAILAAIAVPNFLEAQTRAKVSRAKTDMRSLATALEAYCVDSNRYPAGVNASWEALDPDLDFFYWPIGYEHRLTTPVAYITSSHIIDPFKPNHSGNPSSRNPKKPTSYQYICFDPIPNSWMFLQLLVPANAPLVRPYKGWSLSSFGPDREQQAIEWFAMPGNPPSDDPTTKDWSMIYDPTNGTLSNGDIVRWGGEMPGWVFSAGAK